MSNKKQDFGITPPISKKGPEPNEVQATQDLIDTLANHGQYESGEEAQQRQIVLGKLNEIFKEFVKTVSIRNGLPAELAAEVGGKIFTFGSYRLGVHGKGSDIDTLCVAPKHVKREDFLEHMYEVLKNRPEVEEITAVAEAYVPIIKMIFSDIHIDLIFARLAESSVSDDLDLSDDKLLRNIDERCVRSLNGSRVTDEILRLVPNVEAFRTALRCIKVWAKYRAIYSNVMGFFGGVAWAIVVARVCQMFPNAAAGAIVYKFFVIMNEWAWPQPVLLKLIEDGPLAVRVWNPKIYPQDKSHRMPVITPAYPSMCSTHNVTQSTQIITTHEFGRAAEITDKILSGTENWSALFQKSDFFHGYKYYLQVCASSSSAESGLKWAGLVESRLRQLIMKLELAENLEIAHPFIKGFERVTVCRSEKEKRMAQNGRLPEDGATNENKDTSVDENSTMEPFKVWTTIFYVGLSATPRDPNSSTGRKLDITWPVNEFTKMVKGWDTFDADSMCIVINYLKSTQLPLDVFDESEIARVLKKRSKVATKSRQSNLSNPEDRPPPKKRRGSVAGDTDSAVNAEATPNSTAEVPTPELADAPVPLEDGSASEETLKESIVKPAVVLKDGDLSYSEAVKKQEAARRAGNYGGMSSLTSNLTRKGPEIKMKLGSSKN